MIPLRELSLRELSSSGSGSYDILKRCNEQAAELREKGEGRRECSGGMVA